MKPKRSALAILALAALMPSSLLGAPDNDCRVAPTRQERLQTIGDRGELVFASGEHAVLSGVRWPDDGPTARAANTRLMQYRDRPLTVVGRGERDRWGRMRVDASTSPDGSDELAGGLIAAGLAYADAGEIDTLCRTELLDLEAEARAASRGMWTTGVRDARDGTGLGSIEGDFIVAEGRVLSIGERRSRTYLNFARRDEPGLTVTVPKRTWRIMRERGLTAANLKGRRVRVRGRVEIWRGPLLDIASADLIEVLEGEQAPRR